MRFGKRPTARATSGAARAHYCVARSQARRTGVLARSRNGYRPMLASRIGVRTLASPITNCVVTYMTCRDLFNNHGMCSNSFWNQTMYHHVLTHIALARTSIHTRLGNLSTNSYWIGLRTQVPAQ